MSDKVPNKKKIINDPVYGFISIPGDFVFDIIEHPYFQRLRRIRQLGLTDLVYPGALHTRFHHAIGAMYLMTKAIRVIRDKGHEITDEEREAAILAILLHDIGHGPYSHTLEHTLVKGVHHEALTIAFMEAMNIEMDGRLELALAIFKDEHPKRFLHQLVSSQLDVDRLDYLQRDSFYTGVSEGVVGSDRIIKMMNIFEGKLVLEEKGIYSIENFIVSRRLMYWQVYLHKTVVAAEYMLVNILKRARELFDRGEDLFVSPALKLFLTNKLTIDHFKNDPKWLHQFAQLDDYDVMGAIKVWQFHDDFVLSNLCKMLIDRSLFKVNITEEPIDSIQFESMKTKYAKLHQLDEESAKYFFITEKLTNNAYKKDDDQINLLMKDNSVKDLAQASDNLNISALSGPVEKYCLLKANHFYRK